MTFESLAQPPFINDIRFSQTWPEYLNTPGMNPSTLVHGLKSMLALKSSRESHDKPQRAMLIGSMAHTLVFEADTFGERFKVYEGKGTRANKAYKEFAAEHSTHEIAKQGEYDQAAGIAAAVRNCPAASVLIDATLPEVTVLCEDHGLQCKGRVDGLGSGLLIDLKTTANVEAYAFGSVCARLNYVEKLSCYRRWVARVNSQSPDSIEVKVICVEQKPPYDIAIDNVPGVALDNAWDRMALILDDVGRCIKSGDWPGVSGGKERELVIPNWSMPDDGLDWEDGGDA